MSEESACLLKLLSDGSLQKFLYECLHEIIGYNVIPVTNFNCDVEHSQQELSKTKIFIKHLYREAVINDQFEMPEGLDANVYSEIKQCFEVCKPQILTAVTKDCLNGSNLQVVTNIDWKLKWVLGSSSLASLSEPRLQVTLHCINNENNKPIEFECDLDQVNSLINELENIKLNFK